MPPQFIAEQAYEFAASPRSVFDALTRPDRLEKWFLSKASISLKKGGMFAFDWVGGYHVESQVLRVVRGKSVAFRWVDRLPNGRRVETVAAFRMARRGRTTRLQLRHSGFTDPEHFAECSSRWAYYLTNLKSVLDHGTDLRSPGDW